MNDDNIFIASTMAGKAKKYSVNNNTLHKHTSSTLKSLFTLIIMKKE